MGARTDIPWTDATWPIVQGCDPVSQGCVHCYVVPLLWRMMHNPNPKISAPLQGLIEKHVTRSGEEVLRFTGKLALREDRLDWPLQWKTPRMIFVPSHGDIFHKDVPDSFLDKIFAVMALCPQHTFQVLTKRPERMREYLTKITSGEDSGYLAALDAMGVDAAVADGTPWPLPNVWLGTSVEDQPNADERIPQLLSTPAAIRFVSLEPRLADIHFRWWLTGAVGSLKNLGHLATTPPFGRYRHKVLVKGLDWVIDGGESGSDPRPFDIDASRALEAQCVAAGVAYFRKQLGGKPFEREPSAWPNGFPGGDGSLTLMPDGFGRLYVTGFKDRKAEDPAEWPADLRRREFPRRAA